MRRDHDHVPLSIRESPALVERLWKAGAMRADCLDVRDALAEVERLREEIEHGWLALGIRRNPQHDVTIADGINRLREQHAARLAEIEAS
jgi:hypothetical protein